MDAEQFRKAGHELVDWIADYYTNIEKFPVLPATKPDEVKNQIPLDPPQEGEAWDKIKADIDTIITPNITHWQHPNFFAFFPCNSSYPAILGELLSAGLNVQGMLWVTSPACTELEVAVMDWLAKMINLPPTFLSTSKGGGVIHGTASEAVLVGLIAARKKSLKRLGLEGDASALAKLTVYCTSQTHSSVKKACMVAGIHLDNLRTLEVELPTLALTPEILGAAIKADKEKGLIPTFAVATIGTTSTNANDPIDLLGALCNKEDVWIHIDAAYGGSALILPELQHLMRGVELVDSFNFNPHKWMRINFDCSAFWVKDKEILVDALSVTPEYLRNKLSDSGAVVDYRDWQIPLGRRFRALKVWFALRTYGVKGMQDFIRSHIKMAEELEKWIEADSRFELVFKRSLALVCFRVKATNELNQKLVESINASREFYLTHTVIGGQYLIRFSIGAPQTELRHVEHCWKTLQAKAAELLSLEAAN